MIPIGKIVHRFVLFVNDADASFVGADDDRFDVFCCLPALSEGGINLLGCFDGSLRMEFSYIADGK